MMQEERQQPGLNAIPASSESATGRRAHCGRCLRAMRTCICDLCPDAARIDNQAALLIVQHPDEEKEAKGSARLLHLSLQHSVLQCSRDLGAAALYEMLYADGRQPVLLYPPDPGAPPPSPLRLAPQQMRLVALDATWRKSRALLRDFPTLVSLPRLALHAQQERRYLIRKAHAPHQLSTLEACALALAQVENAQQRYAPLLAAFDAFNARWLRFVP
ncbi:tRNA-uridine aminocarboxypropyltransferase [Massilia sp. W12]|uniref:tRNA-uridine aminocarboxypropyltransferase n=1 Tax=Massilia sp. W12 TaxID=3126507 RepID=UPI0030CB364C